MFRHVVARWEESSRVWRVYWKQRERLLFHYFSDRRRFTDSPKLSFEGNFLVAVSEDNYSRFLVRCVLVNTLFTDNLAGRANLWMNLRSVSGTSGVDYRMKCAESKPHRAWGGSLCLCLLDRQHLPS